MTTEDQLINMKEQLISIEGRFNKLENILHGVLEKVDRENRIDVKQEIGNLESEMRHEQ